MTATERASLERERAELRRELLEWLRVATIASINWQAHVDSGDWWNHRHVERRFEIATKAAERIANLLRSLPDEELPAGWQKVAEGGWG